MARAVHLWAAAEQKSRQRARVGWSKSRASLPEGRGDFGLTLSEWPALIAAANEHRRGEWYWAIAIVFSFVAGLAFGSWRP